MTPMDAFWLFLVLVSLQPVLKQKMLEAARQRMIAELEKKRGSRVILLVHRQETMSLLGFPVMRYIDVHDSEEVIRAIHLTDPDVPLDLVIHTPGGLVLAATQIARAVKRHRGKVTVFVPHMAMSGGTLIALAADEIVMDPHAVLGPVDPQLGQMPAASFVKVVEEKPIEHVDDETLVMADMGRKAISQLQETILELIGDRYPEDKARRIAETLSEGRWTHDYPITPEHARQLGLPVTDNVPKEVYKLMDLYPQPKRTLPSVEYLPVPRQAGNGKSAGSHAGS